MSIHRLLINSYKSPAIFVLSMFLSFISIKAQINQQNLKINDNEYFETRGVNILVFSNWYNSNFSDSKISGIELIHHGVRTATNGDVRLESTPEQWDAIPTFDKREVDKDSGTIKAYLSYPEYNFNYTIEAHADRDGILLSVILDNPLPTELEGMVGFNLEFLPSAYFEKTYLMDNNAGTFPLYPIGPMKPDLAGNCDPLPMASGYKLTLAPEDPERRVVITSLENELMLYDGRNQAQNGWYVVRSLIPSGKSGKVIEWYLTANSIPGWIRKPVITHSQVGYHPDQKKVAVIELDLNDTPANKAELLKVNADGSLSKVFESELINWGKYLRYNYLKFDFTTVTGEGIYIIEYGNVKSDPFRIAKNVYEDAWHATLDIFFPVQMDHVLVNEAYRVWHGASHLDDALQAPVNHEHFDLYAQGPTTDTPYKPGEHIEGLNIGGWFDAGDYDIRTQTQYATVLNLVKAWESFGITRDQTTVDYARKYVDIHVPDGYPDILQQIEHGTLALIAQHRAVGHAIPGIIVPDLSQYTHLGDALTMTDNMIYDPEMEELESNGIWSGKFDDRWAFTSRSSALNYGSIAALAAASRALSGYNDDLANECLETAERVWDEEQGKEPDTFRFGNTTGGRLETEELKAAVELLITTGDKKYKTKINSSLDYIENTFLINASLAVQVIPYMDEEYKSAIEKLVVKYKNVLDEMDSQNPFGVPIYTGGWAGNGRVIRYSMNASILHNAFPEIIDKEYIFRGLNYIYGCHPGSSISFVSGVGTVSKKVAYGNNRADYSFVAGGIVPGVLILKPDFPENKEDWPFLWGENEYVIGVGASYIYLVNAANQILNK